VGLGAIAAPVKILFHAAVGSGRFGFFAEFPPVILQCVFGHPVHFCRVFFCFVEKFVSESRPLLFFTFEVVSPNRAKWAVEAFVVLAFLPPPAISALDRRRFFCCGRNHFSFFGFLDDADDGRTKERVCSMTVHTCTLQKHSPIICTYGLPSRPDSFKKLPPSNRHASQPLVHFGKSLYELLFLRIIHIKPDCLKK